MAIPEQQSSPATALPMLVLWGHILPYPKDGLVQPKHILRANSLGEDNFSIFYEKW